MPWDSAGMHRHNAALRGAKAGHAARIANAVLKQSGDEGMALAVANRWAKNHKRASGGPAPQVPTYQTAAPAVNAQGYVPVSQGGTYNLDLTTGAMQPSSNAELGKLALRGLPNDPNKPPPPPTAGLSPLQMAQLQDMQFQQLQFQNNMGGGSEGGGSGFEGGGQDPSGNDGLGGLYARGGRRAGGGPSPMSMSQATPWWTRSEARGEEAHPSGLVPGMGGGRQDNVPMNLAPHSHVIPAMVVAGMGQGNGAQGAANIAHALSTGPFGTAIPKVPTRTPKFAAPHPPKLARGGGMERGGVRTLVSPGELIIEPHEVLRIGNGDYDKGHDYIDRCIVGWRRQILANERKQRGPIKE